MIIRYSKPLLSTGNYIILTIVVCFSLFSCSKTIYKGDTKKSEAARIALTPTDTFIRNQLKGIDFSASGNDPVSWTLTLDLEKNFTFKPADGKTLITSPVTVVSQSGTDTYTTKTDAGPMKVVVSNEQCITGSKEAISRKVAISINNKQYTGCGKYLYDFLLNDIWELEYINNKEPLASDYRKQLPRIEFNLQQSKMLGYDGCNDINSTITIQGNHISFAVIIGSTGNCTTSKLFIEKLSGRTVDYYIKDDKLVLYLIDDSKITFRKAQ